jgi:transaldolase
MNIKMYADGADKSAILALNQDRNVEGFTTNPTLMRKAGVKDYVAFCTEIAELVDPKPISFEVFSDDILEMEKQAHLIQGFGANVYVKIPITNTKGESTSQINRRLSQSGVKLNVTAIFTEAQVAETVSSLEGGAASVISVFAGRIADTGIDPVPMMKNFAIETSRHSQIELLWASPREILNLIQADSVGCDIITMTPDLFAKLPSLGKDLSEFSLDTVKMFYSDAVSSGFELKI